MELRHEGAPRVWLRRGILILAAALAFGCQSPAVSQPIADIESRSGFDGWKDADIIFIERDMDDAAPLQPLAKVSKSPLFHAGLLRITGGGPVVIDTYPSLWEFDVEDFLATAKNGHFAVYRRAGLAKSVATAPPRRANDYLNTPYDPWLVPGRDAFNCSELIAEMFSSIGLTIGTARPLEELVDGEDAIERLFGAAWSDHPSCRRTGGSASCRQVLMDLPVVLPDTIMEDADLTCVYSTTKAPGCGMR